MVTIGISIFGAARVSGIESLKFESNQYQIACYLNCIGQCLNRIFVAIQIAIESNRDLISPITARELTGILKNNCLNILPALIEDYEVTSDALTFWCQLLQLNLQEDSTHVLTLFYTLTLEATSLTPCTYWQYKKQNGRLEEAGVVQIPKSDAKPNPNSNSNLDKMSSVLT